VADIDTGAAEQPAGTSIRDALNAAFTASEGDTTEAPAATGSETGATPEAGESEAAAGNRARDAQGRFTKAQQEANEKAAAVEKQPGAAEQAAATEKPAADDKQPEATKPGEAPAHWSAADKALVAKLPAEIRQEYIDRFKAMEAGFAPKLQRAADLERNWGEVEKLVAPHAEALKQGGWTVPSIFKAWMDVEMRLAREPEAALLDIAKHYRIDLPKLAAKLGGGASSAQQQPVVTDTNGKPAATDASGEYVDPEIKALRDKLAALEGTLTGITDAEKRRTQDAQRVATQRSLDDIQAFADAKGEDGQPSHPFFAEVAADMVAMAQGAKASGQTPKLQDLYDRAVWANPTTRAKQIAAETDKASAKARAETEKAQRDAAAAAKAKAASAQRAGASVTGAPSGTGQAFSPKSKGSLRADLEAALDEQG